LIATVTIASRLIHTRVVVAARVRKPATRNCGVDMRRYKYFDLKKFIKACIVTVLLLPVSAVAFAAFNAWCGK